MLIIALILLAVAIGCFVAHINAKNKVGEILYVPSSRIGDISERAAAVADVLGKGYSSDYTEIKGKMEAPEVLTSPLGEAECVYYTSSIDREWEEEEYYTDDEGNEKTRINSGRDQIYSDNGWVRFQVDDGSGKIWIDPEHADIDLSTSVDRYEPEQSIRVAKGVLRLGDLRLDVRSPSLPGQRWIKGYHFHEQIFEPSGELYLLGTVVDREGDLTLVKPAEKGQRYVISHKSEEQLVEEITNSSKWLLWGSIASAVLGLILGVIGLATGNTGF
ncbi:MAG: GIDE domain-containing protein [Candidatus Sericytochromatia bacterium]